MTDAVPAERLNGGMAGANGTATVAKRRPDIIDDVSEGHGR
jgi:hypothetical protein